MRYTKKPVTIEAIRFVGLTDMGDPQFDTSAGMPDWLMEACAAPEGDPGSAFISLMKDGSKKFEVATLEGWHTVSDGDWIIRGIKGELYPCKPDIFEATYDAATGPELPEVTAAKESMIAVDGETSGAFLKRVGYDGKLWAEAFVQQFEGKSIGHDASSHGVDDMLGWFANAIMAGYDAGRVQGWKEDSPYGDPRWPDQQKALGAALAKTDVEHPSDLPTGAVGRLRDAAKTFVIGEGFQPQD